MSKMSIADAAEHFGISREAIHNRVRRGSLSSVVEDGVKLVVIDESVKVTNKTQTRKATPQNDDRYYKLLEEQNSSLQDRVEKLENETKTLRDQKEKMLVLEREKIEEIYKQKDEQLKNILSAISSKFMLDAPKEEVYETETVEVEIEPIESDIDDKIISLKKHLKKSNFSSKKVQKIKARFEKVAKKDKRITFVDNKCYINLAKYDYSDLLK